MNTYQLCGAIRTKLRAVVWGATTTKVFDTDSVRVTAGPTPEGVFACIMPVALISPLDSTADPQHHEAPGAMVQRVQVTIISVAPSDALGEGALMGANATSTTASPGKGLLQIEERLYHAIQLLTIQDGIIMQFVHAGSAGARIDDEVGYVVFRDYFFDAFITTDAD